MSARPGTNPRSPQWRAVLTLTLASLAWPVQAQTALPADGGEAPLLPVVASPQVELAPGTPLGAPLPQEMPSTQPTPQQPLLADLAPGLMAKVLVRAGDLLSDGSTFAPKNDFTGYLPLNAHEGYLMVGHEIRWGKDALAGRLTRLLLRDNEMVAGQVWASGMHNPCAGTVTPWKTVLTCEEYPHDNFPGDDGEARRENYLKRRLSPGHPLASWGWVYEVNALGPTPAGQTRRLTALGRFSHESAVVVGEREVYLTEDYDPGFLYKFVASKPRDLSEGKLYAYQRKEARWIPIIDPLNAHQAAETAGATKFVRLEDVQMGPDRALYIAETGHPKWKDPYGRVLRLNLQTSRMSVFAQGDGVLMAQPDNLSFDSKGNMYVCEDQYEDNIAKFGPNELLRRDRRGRWARLAAFPKGAEPSGPTWSPDGKVLFLSVLWGDRSGILSIRGIN
ncbi:MAG: alkaline phosphatase PhoX [Candidatus Sericytochromatia bacterium]|nr:alkaline phosphatase PhoX [Candidatus Sericytochromatia bacterium]